MKNYLNIQANKKHLVTKIVSKETNFPLKKFSNKVKQVLSNPKRPKQINNNKENKNKNILTDIGNLSLQQDYPTINSDRPFKPIIYKKKTTKLEREKLKETRKVKFTRNSCNYNEQNLQKKKIQPIIKGQKAVTSIPLYKNYVPKALSIINTNNDCSNKTKIYIEHKNISINNVNRKNTYNNNCSHIMKNNDVNTSISNCYTDCSFLTHIDKTKSADVSPNRRMISSIIQYNKYIHNNIIEEDENENIKNNSMIVDHNKKRRGIIKLSLNDCNKNKIRINRKSSLFSSKIANLPLNETIINSNPQMVDDYFDEIYKYLKSIENSDLPKENYMKTVQKDINEKMRKILLDWLIDVHAKFKLSTETLFLTINIIDRYLSKKSIHRKYLQLLGVTSMLIASKYEDIYPPEIKDFIFMTDNAYTKEELIKMENDILDKIQFNMTYPTSFRFLEIFKKIINLKEIDFYRCRYFIENALFDYNCCHFSPSLIAATSIFLNYKINKTKNKDLKYLENKILTGIQYEIKEMIPCLNSLINSIKAMGDIGNKYTAIKRKFEKEENMKISKEKIDYNILKNN